MDGSKSAESNHSRTYDVTDRRGQTGPEVDALDSLRCAPDHARFDQVAFSAASAPNLQGPAPDHAARSIIKDTKRAMKRRCRGLDSSRLHLVALIQTSRDTWVYDAHQPAARHGGKARIDKETIMVWKTLASLDAWLALAEEVLAEQRQLSERDCEVRPPQIADQLPLFTDEAV
jgi:hypothetical protein